MSKSPNGFEVQILNDRGEPVGTKPYPEVDRRNDILRNVFIFAITPDKEMILATITDNDLSKKLYKGKLGSPSVTLVRVGEDCAKAAARALVNDLAIHPQKLVHLGDNFETMSDGTRRLMCVFYCIHDANMKVNKMTLAGVQLVHRVELATMLQREPDRFSPQFIAAYERWKRELPF